MPESSNPPCRKCERELTEEETIYGDGWCGVCHPPEDTVADLVGPL